jgi:uncharacterized protein YkwD
MRYRLAVGSVTLVFSLLVTAQAQEKKAPVKLSAQERELLDLTNAERKKNDLPPLKANAILTKVARAHSENMAKQEKLDHELDGKNPLDRVKEAKYDYRRMAENIAMSGGEPSMEFIMKLWMESPPHKSNILKDGFTEIGIGVAKNGKGETYCTQVFGTPLE